MASKSVSKSLLNNIYYPLMVYRTGQFKALKKVELSGLNTVYTSLQL